MKRKTSLWITLFSVIVWLAACRAEPEVVVITATPEPTQAGTAVAACQTVRSLNLHPGPGTVYNPPLRALPANEQLAPLAFQASGFPGGQWVLVQVTSSGESGWVSASPEFISCNTAVASLPAAGSIPFTPTPPPTNTPPASPTPLPTTAVSRPPQLANIATGGEDAQEFPLEFSFQLDNDFLLRIDARDTSIPNGHNGAGISHVTFQVTEEGDSQIFYAHQENHAGYCIFSGGEPDCRPWPTNSHGRYTWGEDGPEVLPGRYRIDVAVFFPNGETFNWNTRFDMAVP